MDKEIEFLRKLEAVVIPKDFTYFHHSTSYIPISIKKRYCMGRFLKNWNKLPVDEYTIKKEMSFVERDHIIEKNMLYTNPLSKNNIINSLPDYSKPFCIRVVIPKIESVRNNILNVSDDYKKEFENIWNGYGDARHPKLRSGERIIMIGSSIEDEISNKKIDIFYGVRECDLSIYFSSVLKAIDDGYSMNASVNIPTGSNNNYYPYNYVIKKTSNRDRYIGSPSLFDLELLDDYKDILMNNRNNLPIIDDNYRYFKMYNNYKNSNEDKKII